MIDLNFFLGRHQVSLMRATAAATPEARLAHLGLARQYSDYIARSRVRTGVADLGLMAR